ncbi:hypothetical protein MSNKSG1_00671 [Marinobacter santoriniensis NKSG1]|jgi:hypothetical protein|uniref:Uncharacterized protein n=1 Tax=Marinobacter santoriniensis NKSG1 TaxID=1288826 RepID=M7CZ02_9GAMM|nr:hypothetical protein [Marinobacter santoriniensis]EMP57475.1 hypothetical protein MSNKSG1_00671 [Marinobacter santoriniensis NKSG1]
MKKILLELAAVLLITLPAVLMITDQAAQTVFLCATLAIAYGIVFLSIRPASRNQDQRWRF